MINKHTLMVMFYFLGLIPLSSAVAQHSDVLLADFGGKVAVGTAGDIGGGGESFTLGAGAFETILVPGFFPVDTKDYEASDPGFFALDGVADASTLTNLGAAALPGNTAVSISASSFVVDSVSAELFYWDGSGAVDFSPAPLDTTFSFVTSTGFATTGTNGGMDDHPIYRLDRTGVELPSDGVYLISPTIDVAGLTSSENFYILLLSESLIGSSNLAAEDAEAIEEALEDLEEGLATEAIVDFGGGNSKDFAFFEEAVEYVEESLVVPEPTTGGIALLTLGIVVSARFRAKVH